MAYSKVLIVVSTIPRSYKTFSILQELEAKGESALSYLLGTRKLSL